MLLSLLSISRSFFSPRKKFCGLLKNELDELRNQNIEEKVYNVIEMYECDWWKMNKTDDIVKQPLRESFPHKVPLREKRLLENIKSGSLFGYAQCDIEVP